MANKDVGGREQMTIIWHVDNLMTSCKLDFELTKFSCYLVKIYGSKLVMHTGSKHGVHEMKYLTSIVQGFLGLIVGKGASPAGDRLFEI